MITPRRGILNLRRRAMDRHLFVRVTLPAVLLGLLLLGTGLLSLWSIRRLQADQARLLSTDVRSLLAAQEMEVRLRQLRFHSFVYVLDPTPERRQPVDADRRQFEEALRQTNDSASRPDEWEQLAVIEASFRAYCASIDRTEDFPPPSASRSDILRWADAHRSTPLQETCEELLQR